MAAGPALGLYQFSVATVVSKIAHPIVAFSNLNSVVVRQCGQSGSHARAYDASSRRCVLRSRERIWAAPIEIVDSAKLDRERVPRSDMHTRHLGLGVIEVTQTIGERVRVVAITRRDAEVLREDPMKKEGQSVISVVSMNTIVVALFHFQFHRSSSHCALTLTGRH